MHMFPFSFAAHSPPVCRRAILLAQHRASWIIHMFQISVVYSLVDYLHGVLQALCKATWIMYMIHSNSEMHRYAVLLTDNIDCWSLHVLF